MSHNNHNFGAGAPPARESHMTCKRISAALAAGFVFAISTVVQADTDGLAREGSVGCGGSHFLRLGNTELQTSIPPPARRVCR